jgi:hypothetical protein
MFHLILFLFTLICVAWVISGFNHQVPAVLELNICAAYAMATTRIHRLYAGSVQGNNDIRDAQVYIYPAPRAHRWYLVRIVAHLAALLGLR